MYSYIPDSDEPQRPHQQQQQQQQPYRPSLPPRSHSTSYLKSGSGEALSHSHSHSHSHSLSHAHSPNAHASTNSSSCNTTSSSSYTPSTSTSYIRESRSGEFDAPRTCDSVWIHSEHRDLSTRYTKALEDLATSRSDVIRLTTELASVHARISSLASPSPSAPPSPVLQHVPVFAPPRAPPAPSPAAPSPASVTTPISPNDPFAAMKASFAGRPSPVSTTSISNTPPSRRDSELPSPIEFSSSHSPIPLSASRGSGGGSGRARYYNAPTLPSQPPDPNVVNQYLAELGSWSRPRYDYTQLMHVHNYSNDAAVKSNLRTEMVDLEGICPTPAQWKLWIVARLTIVKDLLDPGKSWKNQRDQDKRLAVQIVEKRFPALALCEPDRCWKAAIFLQRRLDEAIKTGHETERRKGANSVNNTLGTTTTSAPTFQGMQAIGQWDGKNEAGRTHEEGGWSMMMNI
ncbi:BZ3500_MvSof-1268-A1-R1_Chr4-4g07549 [Microbotryum saponariae]|uniref:BZ3500_MvSof-1268-A1-R1_Chr4-4g07549 protein n=1 Tax=Microbotryum saponariae TaxID=289078 RepID=A0A2X0LP72_9BASI|nr:BZ3500_MvSof-1268-A1-R1_Chr4-4g07549 [Microbotryum saponariae]SDA07210.1 BZ3501_MvSof-1269-A2-R1_Chr4-3g07257 [Microbotryum saponariae]